MSTWIDCLAGRWVNLDRADRIVAVTREGGCDVLIVCGLVEATWRSFDGPTSIADASQAVLRLLAAAGVRHLRLDV